MKPNRSSIATPRFCITSAAAALRSTIDAAACFCSGLSGIGVVLAQITFALVCFIRCTSCSSLAV